MKQKQQFADFLEETRRQLPSEAAPLGRLLGCLTAALEAPYTDLWQAFLDALQTETNEQEETMPERQLILRCVYCGFDTTLVVKVSRQVATPGKKISVVRYCAHCNRPNRIEVPENVDVHVFILGRDKGFLGNRQDIPILQGEKDL